MCNIYSYNMYYICLFNNTTQIYLNNFWQYIIINEELITDRLKPDLLNTNIFPLLVSGLADASPTIRELTVRVSNLKNHICTYNLLILIFY